MPLAACPQAKGRRAGRRSYPRAGPYILSHHVLGVFNGVADMDGNFVERHQRAGRNLVGRILHILFVAGQLAQCGLDRAVHIPKGFA